MAAREDRVLKVMNVAMAAGATFAALTGALGFAEMIQIVSSLGAALLGAAFESSRVFSAK